MSHEDLFNRVLENARRPPVGLLEDEPTIVVETSQGDEEGNPTEPVEAELAKVSSISVPSLFRNAEAHPLVLDLILLSKYGPEWMQWELETLSLRVTEDFKTPTIADVNIEKLQACKALHLVDDFWLRWEVFNPCCAALNGSFADFQRMQVPEVAECMVAVDIANRIRDDVSWSSEVKTFLGVVHRHEGILCPQPPLEFVTVDTEGLPVDCQAVSARWPDVRATGRAPRGDSIEDEQLRRLLAAHQYLEVVRTRLDKQLPILQHV